MRRIPTALGDLRPIRRSLRIGLAAVAAMLTGVVVAAQPAQAEPPPDNVSIAVRTVNGSGCPQGSATVAMSADRAAFTVSYSRFVAQAGPGIPTTELRKNCQLVLTVTPPQGFSFALQKVDHRGQASIQRGANAVAQWRHHLTGQVPTALGLKTILGPYDDDWQATSLLDLSALFYGPCGAPTDVNTAVELRVNKATSTGTSYISLDSTDDSPSSTYQLAWRRC